MTARKSLTELLAARGKQRTRAGKNLASFLVEKEEILAALSDGWPVKEIWNTLLEAKRITMSYQTFLRYVSKLNEQNPAFKSAPKGLSTPMKKEGSFVHNASPKPEDIF